MFLHIGTRTILNHNLVMILYLWPSGGPGAFTDGYQHATETSYQSHPGCCLTEAQENPREIKPLNVSCPLNELAPCEPSHAPSPPLRPKFKTQLNSFGLFRLYGEDSLPIIDPDTNNSLDEAGLSTPHNDTSSQPMETITTGGNPFYPYPNETLLLLGDWYWNQGHQKS